MIFMIFGHERPFPPRKLILGSTAKAETDSSVSKMIFLKRVEIGGGRLPFARCIISRTVQGANTTEQRQFHGILAEIRLEIYFGTRITIENAPRTETQEVKYKR